MPLTVSRHLRTKVNPKSNTSYWTVLNLTAPRAVEMPWDSGAMHTIFGLEIVMRMGPLPGNIWVSTCNQAQAVAGLMKLSTVKRTIMAWLESKLTVYILA